jgi:hypothetical protein
VLYVFSSSCNILANYNLLKGGTTVIRLLINRGVNCHEESSIRLPVAGLKKAAVVYVQIWFETPFQITLTVFRYHKLIEEIIFFFIHSFYSKVGLKTFYRSEYSSWHWILIPFTSLNLLDLQILSQSDIHKNRVKLINCVSEYRFFAFSIQYISIFVKFP